MAKAVEAKAIEAHPTTQMSLRDRILNLNDRREEIVVVPQWDNMEILMRSLTAGDWAELQQLAEVKFINGQPTSAIKQWSNIDIVIRCAFNPKKGEKLFTEADRDILQTKHMGVIDMLGNVVDRLSGTTAQDQVKAREDFQETVGNDSSTT